MWVGSGCSHSTLHTPTLRRGRTFPFTLLFTVSSERGQTTNEKGAEPCLPWQVTSRVRTRSLLLPTRIMGVWGWVSLRRRRSWAVRWKLRLSVTENTRTHTSHCRADRSWQMSRSRQSEQEEFWEPLAQQQNMQTHAVFFFSRNPTSLELNSVRILWKKTSCHCNPKLPAEKPQNATREAA